MFPLETISRQSASWSVDLLEQRCPFCRAQLRRATRCRREHSTALCERDCDLFVCDECGLMQSDATTTCRQATAPR